jgi:hypothetical protein
LGCFIVLGAFWTFKCGMCIFGLKLPRISCRWTETPLIPPLTSRNHSCCCSKVWLIFALVQKLVHFGEQILDCRSLPTWSTLQVQRRSAARHIGYVITEAPVLVYSDVPLAILPAVTNKNQNSPDRVAAEVSYEFQTSDNFQILVKDQLAVAGQTLTIQSIRLAAAGLRQFTATVTR